MPPLDTAQGADDWVTAPAAPVAAPTAGKDDWITAPAATKQQQDEPLSTSYSPDSIPPPMQAAPVPSAATPDRSTPAPGMLEGLRDTIQQGDISALKTLAPEPDAGMLERAGRYAAMVGVHEAASLAQLPIAALQGLAQGPSGALTINPATNTLGLTPEAASVVPFAAGGLRFGGAASEAASVAAIGKAGDVDTAIEAAGKAVSAPPTGDLFADAPAAEIPTIEVRPTPRLEEPAAVPAEPVAPPTTAAEARAVASDYYKQADALGGDLTPDFTNSFIDSAEKIAPQTEEGRIFTGDTAVTSLVDRMQGLRDHPLSLQAAQEIDEALGGLVDKEYSVAGMSKEGKHLQDLQATLRNMIEDAGEGDVSGGTQGFEALSLARQAWSQAAKMGDVERILNRAALTDNPATSIKSGIRVLLSSRRARGYSEAEIDALKDAASRGVIGGTLHVFGSRLTPLIAGGIGATGGPLGAIATAGITHALGTGARALATNIQEGRAQKALSVLGAGVPPAVEQAIREATPTARSPVPAAPAPAIVAPTPAPEPIPIVTQLQREQAKIAAMKARAEQTRAALQPRDMPGEIIGAGDLWRMPPEQLESMLADKQEGNHTKLVRALGSEDAAAEFNRLDRMQNSSNPERADRGGRLFNERFGRLSPEQERLIYGIGETDASAEDMQEILSAHESNPNPTDAAYSAALALRSISPRDIAAVPAGKATGSAQAAYVRLGNAWRDMQQAGVQPNRIAATIVDALVEQGGWSVKDANEVIGGLLNQLRAGRGDVPSGARLTGQGFNVAGMREPVLVRERTAPLDMAGRAKLADEMGASPTMAMSASERAAADAKRIPTDVLSMYQGGDVTSPRNAAFVRAFADRAIPTAEQASFMTADGDLSIEGAARMRNALTQRAYGSNTLVTSLAEDADPELKAFGGALVDAAGPMAKVRGGIETGEIDPGNDIAAGLIDAAQTIQTAKRARISLADAVSQVDAFAQPDPWTERILTAAYGAGLKGRMSRAKLAGLLSNFAAELQVQSGLFGDSKSAAQVFDEAARKHGHGSGRSP